MARMATRLAILCALAAPSAGREASGSRRLVYATTLLASARGFGYHGSDEDVAPKCPAALAPVSAEDCARAVFEPGDADPDAPAGGGLRTCASPDLAPGDMCVDIDDRCGAVATPTCGLSHIYTWLLGVDESGAPLFDSARRRKLLMFSSSLTLKSQWIKGASGQLPRPREKAAGGFSEDGNLILAGGLDAAGKPTDTVWMYDSDAKSWRTTLPKLNQARRSLGCVVVDEKVYALGGRDENGDALQSVEMLDLKKIERGWSYVPPMKVARAPLAVSAVGSKVYVFGTDVPSGNMYDHNVHGSVEQFDARGGNWVAELPFLDVPYNEEYPVGGVSLDKQLYAVLEPEPKPIVFPALQMEPVPAAPTFLFDFPGLTTSPPTTSPPTSQQPTASPRTFQPAASPTSQPAAKPSAPPAASPTSKPVADPSSAPPTAKPTAPPTTTPAPPTAKPSTSFPPFPISPM